MAKNSFLAEVVFNVISSRFTIFKINNKDNETCKISSC